MHQVAFVINSAVTWAMLWESEESAKNALAEYQRLMGPEQADGRPMISLIDDFGHNLCMPVKNIQAALYEDLEKSRRAFIERSVHQQISQVKAQQALNANPVIKAANLQHGGVPMLQPGMRN